MEWSSSHSPFGKKKINFHKENKMADNIEPAILSPPLLTNSQMELFEDTTLTQQSMDQSSECLQDSIVPICGTILANHRRLKDQKRTTLRDLGERLKIHSQEEVHVHVGYSRYTKMDTIMKALKELNAIAHSNYNMYMYTT